jgi:hypothetical protein
MKRREPTDLAASVRQRLLDISRRTKTDANLIWTRYAVERLLYRLASSEHAREFALKGAMLFSVWTRQPYRPTLDLDLLGFGEDSAERVVGIFRRLCGLEVEPDGLIFDAESVRAEPIRADQEYQGQRVALVARLGKARIPLQVDIGFGDVVTPRAEQAVYPTLLDFPAPHIRACTRETVVAEKLQAMIALGIANSRMKDFYDLHVLARDFAFEGRALSSAIQATFERRRTPVPAGVPLALSDDFAADRAKTIQWNAFLRKGGLQDLVPSLAEVVAHLRGFLLPPLSSLAAGDLPSVFEMTWARGGPWR